MVDLPARMELRLARHFRHRLRQRRSEWDPDPGALWQRLLRGRVVSRASDSAYHILLDTPPTIIVAHLEGRCLTLATVYDPIARLHTDIERAWALPLDIVLGVADGSGRTTPSRRAHAAPP